MILKALVTILVLIAYVSTGHSLEIQWEGTKGDAESAPLVTETEMPSGETTYRVAPSSVGEWQGMTGKFSRPIDLSSYAGISFNFRKKLLGGRKTDIVLRLEYEQNSGKSPFIYRTFLSGKDNEWEKIYIPFDLYSWNAAEKSAGVSFETAIGITIYPFKAMKNPEQFMEIGKIIFISREEQNNANINVMGYNYINHPTSGDPDEKVLTDDNKTMESQAVYREYSDNLSVVFDLGAIYTITRTELSAFAPGSHNFADMTISAGTARDNLRPVGVITNQLDGSKEELCSWIIDNSFIGRYVKLEASKPRPDFPVYLSEVEFYGHEPSRDEMSQAMLAVYDNGPELPERSESSCHRLVSGDLECWVDRRSGMINGIFHHNKVLVERLYHTMMTMTKSKDTVIDHKKDTVVKVDRLENGIVFEVVNSDLPGITLVKEYKIVMSELYERISIKSEQGLDPYFLRLETNVVLNKEFRNNGVYESWGDGHYLSREFASNIIIDKNVCNMPTMIFENHAKNTTLLHHIFRYNDRFMMLNHASEEEQRTQFRPNGYRLALAVIVPTKAPNQSIETRLAFTAGSLLSAFDTYRDLPEVRSFYEMINRPSWLRDIKLVAATSWQGACIEGAERCMRNYNRLLMPNGFIVGDFGEDNNSRWGEYPVSDKVFNQWGGYSTANEISRRNSQVKEICPFLKTFMYTWVWSSYNTAKPVLEHPEWFVRHLRNGGTASWFPGAYGINHLRLFGIPEARNESRDAILKMLQYYNLDCWYLDGGNCGSYARDWDRIIQDDPHGYMDFYLDMRQ